MAENLEDEKLDTNKSANQSKGPAFGARYVQILLITYCILVGISTRGSFAVQIVAMTSQNSSSPNPDIHTYPTWEHSHTVLSSFYWLYVVSNIISGPLEKEYGPKWFFLGAIFLNCVFYLLIPTAADRYGEYGVLFCRLIQGFGSGFMFPTQQMLLGLWAPTEERTRAIISVNTGMTIGTMIGTIIPGVLSTTRWGWPASFYVIGSVGLVWCVLYLAFGHGSPATHPSITLEEKMYIQKSLNQHQNVDVPIPFLKIFKSIHIWAVLIAQLGVAWSNNMALTEYSTYLDKVMNFDIQSNGLYSAIPPLVGLLAGFVSGPLSDYLIMRNYISTLNARRIFHMAGCLGIAASLISLSYLKESQKVMAIFLMVVVYISQASLVCGNATNMIDLSPRFAGIVFGISNASGQALGLFAPLLVQFIVNEDDHDITRWRKVFVISAIIMIASALFFVIFASAERQSWDGPVEETEKERRKKKISVISLTGDIVILS